MTGYGYGTCAPVAIDSAVFILFAVSFFHPSGGRDWRALGGFSAFVVALLPRCTATRRPSPLQRPTLHTLVTFPVLLVVYRRLAIREERDVRAHFAEAWDLYATATPRFIPRFHRGL